MVPKARQVGETQVLHASAVAVHGRALLISGPSGSGKSSLALELLAFGANLIADDRTVLTTTENGPPLASCPQTICGQIEARGVGILLAETGGPSPVAAMVDLSQTETARMPMAHTCDVMGWPVPCFHKVATGYFAAALMQYLKGGRSPE